MFVPPKNNDNLNKYCLLLADNFITLKIQVLLNALLKFCPDCSGLILYIYILLVLSAVIILFYCIFYILSPFQRLCPIGFC